MLWVYVINMSVIGLVVAIHYEFLHNISQLIPKMHTSHRLRIVAGVVLSLTAHALEIWIFAVSFYFMHHAEGWGHLAGNFDGSLLDCVYFSFTSYTTLGLGDIEPHGDLRFLMGLESLTGLVLVTWTASFLYLEMSRHWGQD